MFNNIQNDEEDLEKFKAASAKKIQNAETLVKNLQQNLISYERKIAEKRSHRDGLQNMIKSFDGSIKDNHHHNHH